MNEIEEMEQYNKMFNEELKKRPVTNLITCLACNGRGAFYSVASKPEVFKCKKCEGTGYVNAD
jgi:DnaJ-class molecular chaperone